MLLFVAGRERLRAKIRKSPMRANSLNEFQQSVGAVGPARWPIYHHYGTGLFARRGIPHVISARHDRAPATVLSAAESASFAATRRPRLETNGVMRFRGRDGGIYFRRRVAGQKADPFVDRTYHVTRLYARGRNHVLTRRIFGQEGANATA